MKKYKKRIVSISMVLVLILSGLIAIAPASLAESEKDVSKMQINGLTWDTTNQAFVVEISLKFGLATAGEHADFLVGTTLNFDADGNSVTLSGESVIVKAEGATKDPDNMITIDPSFIPWDRNGGMFEGPVDVEVRVGLAKFTIGFDEKPNSANEITEVDDVVLGVFTDGGCVDNSDCDDGIICNGQETCNVETGECEAGIPPPCDDGHECSVGNCDPSTGCDFSSPCTPLPPTPTDNP
jgi:hypothetical protein